MKKRLFTAALASLLLASTASAPAVAQTAADPIESYCATLSEDDHHASDGYELTDAAAIIRQDRANFHEFGVRDPGDEDDSTFDKKANRARLEQMLKRGAMDRSVRNAIVNGTPDVCVDVYRNYINVFLM